MESSIVAKLGAAVRDPAVRRQMARYLTVGFSTAAIEFGLFALCDKVFGLPVPVSNFIAMGIAVVVNFTATRFWTFGGGATTAKQTVRSLWMYAILFVCNNIATSLLITLFIGWGIGSLVAKFITMGLVVAWNFVIYRKIIFR